jgi:hypothetical protein
MTGPAGRREYGSEDSMMKPVGARDGRMWRPEGVRLRGRHERCGDNAAGGTDVPAEAQVPNAGADSAATAGRAGCPKRMNADGQRRCAAGCRRMRYCECVFGDARRYGVRGGATAVAEPWRRTARCRGNGLDAETQTDTTEWLDGRHQDSSRG